MKITTEAWFCAAHRLSNHPGKCKQLHGHNYKVTVSMEGKVDEATGMVVDFAHLKAALKATCARLDHKLLLSRQDPLFKELYDLFLNSTCTWQGHTTCETLAEWIWDDLGSAVTEVTVEETPGCSATYSRQPWSPVDPGFHPSFASEEEKKASKESARQRINNE